MGVEVKMHVFSPTGVDGSADQDIESRSTGGVWGRWMVHFKGTQPAGAKVDLYEVPFDANDPDSEAVAEALTADVAVLKYTITKVAALNTAETLELNLEDANGKRVVYAGNFELRASLCNAAAGSILSRLIITN